MAKPLARHRSLVLLNPQPRPCTATLKGTWSGTLFSTSVDSFLKNMKSMGILVDPDAESMYPWFFDEKIDTIPSLCNRTFSFIELMEGMVYANADIIARLTVKKFPNVQLENVGMRIAIELLAQYGRLLPRILSCTSGTIVLMHSQTPRRDRELSQLALVSTGKGGWKLTGIALKDYIPKNPTYFIFALAGDSPIPFPSRL